MDVRIRCKKWMNVPVLVHSCCTRWIDVPYNLTISYSYALRVGTIRDGCSSTRTLFASRRYGMFRTRTRFRVVSRMDVRLQCGTRTRTRFVVPVIGAAASGVVWLLLLLQLFRSSSSSSSTVITTSLAQCQYDGFVIRNHQRAVPTD